MKSKEILEATKQFHAFVRQLLDGGGDEATDLLTNFGPDIEDQLREAIDNHPMSIIADLLPFAEQEAASLDDAAKEDQSYIEVRDRAIAICDRARKFLNG